MGHAPLAAERTPASSLVEHCDFICPTALFKKQLEPSSVQSTLLTLRWILVLFFIVCLAVLAA
jgi:hypothetical protein